MLLPKSATLLGLMPKGAVLLRLYRARAPSYGAKGAVPLELMVQRHRALGPRASRRALGSKGTVPFGPRAPCSSWIQEPKNGGFMEPRARRPWLHEAQGHGALGSMIPKSTAPLAPCGLRAQCPRASCPWTLDECKSRAQSNGRSWARTHACGCLLT